MRCEAGRREGRAGIGRIRITKKGRKADALAHGGDEGRDKLRKAAGRRTWPVIRGSPNGTTRRSDPAFPAERVGEANGGN